MHNEKLAIIIPTKDRPDKLNQLLKSISQQDIKPSQVIIIDGSILSITGVLKEFPDLEIDYIKAIGSLTTKRNIGIKKLKDEITLVIFFDDDIILEKDSFRKMLDFWLGTSENTAGASFNIISQICRKPSLLEKVFVVNTDIPGKILRSGFQTKFYSLDKTREVNWLFGGATVWRKWLFEKLQFDERFSDYGLFEDVDFSYRAGKEYRLFVVADAKVRHNSESEKIDESFKFGKMQFENRLYFVKKNPELSIPLCYWALSGLFLNNILKGIVGRDSRYINRAKGNIAGFISNLTELFHQRERCQRAKI
ncbi:MAG: glycosyltransferase [Candidatus Omnitrophica bacterium]|nr:glycosyltransferase [Candidatus Omnitrophota bacterium]